jgi:exopolysaccharide production protein ExoY
MHTICEETPVVEGISLDKNAATPVWKRSLDLTFCLIALPPLVLGAMVMLLITRITSPGPLFFKQQRVGHRGKKFMIYKFRTMKVNAETKGHEDYFKQLMGSNAPMVKLDKTDSRLIPLGSLIRASGLDELPQVINVLRGEMSLVGPRPCLPTEFENYKPAQRKRVNAVPGLTGLWQVSGKNRTTFDQMVEMDISYSQRSSLLLDIKIIFLTPLCLLTQIYESKFGQKLKAEPNHTSAPFAPRT